MKKKQQRIYKTKFRAMRSQVTTQYVNFNELKSSMDELYFLRIAKFVFRQVGNNMTIITNDDSYQVQVTKFGTELLERFESPEYPNYIDNSSK